MAGLTAAEAMAVATEVMAEPTDSFTKRELKEFSGRGKTQIGRAVAALESAGELEIVDKTITTSDGKRRRVDAYRFVEEESGCPLKRAMEVCIASGLLPPVPHANWNKGLAESPKKDVENGIGEDRVEAIKARPLVTTKSLIDYMAASGTLENEIDYLVAEGKILVDLSVEKSPRASYRWAPGYPKT